MKLSRYAKKIGLCYQSALNLYHAGQIKGYQLPTGTIIITEEDDVKSNHRTHSNKAVCYARVSSHEQKDDLQRQSERLSLYANAKGYVIYKDIKEVGSGLNDNRAKLQNILSKELNNFDILVIEHKDRLTRFGFNYLELLLKYNNIQIEIINPVANDKEDLIQDFVSIITSFCARIYGQRRNKRKTEQLIRELENEEKEKSIN